MTLDNVMSLNKPGLFALINSVDKRIYIASSVNILKALPRLVEDITTNKLYRNMRDDLGSLSFNVLETCDGDRDRLRIRLAHWTDHYTALGYSLYRNNTGLRYKIRTIVRSDYKLEVQVVDHLSRPTTVGVFSFVTEADRFVERYYPGNIETLVYANNKLTREHYSS